LHTSDEITANAMKEELIAKLHHHFKNSSSTSLRLLKRFREPTMTKSDGLCGPQVVNQLQSRFERIIDAFKRVCPEAFAEWWQSPKWNSKLEGVYKELAPTLTHHAENDQLTFTNHVACLAFFKRAVQMQIGLGFEIDDVPMSSIRHYYEQTLIKTQSMYSKLQKFNPENYETLDELSVEREFCYDIKELPLLAYRDYQIVPLLAFKESPVEDELRGTYMKLEVTNRLVHTNCKEKFQLEDHFSYEKVKLNLEWGFSNALVFINRRHFVVHDLDSPGEEIR